MSSKDAGANSFLLYDKVVQLYESLYYSDQKLALEKPFLDQLLSLLPEEPKILDVGCGPARESIYLQEKGAKYIGVDASSKMLEIARLRNPAGEFHLCDIRRLCFPEGHFDAIISLDSLLHFSKHDFAKIIQQLSKVLRKNGVILLNVEGGVGTVIENFGLGLTDLIPISLYTRSNIEKVFSTTGLHVIDFYTRPIMEGEFPFEKLYILGRKLRNERKKCL